MKPRNPVRVRVYCLLVVSLGLSEAFISLETTGKSDKRIGWWREEPTLLFAKKSGRVKGRGSTSATGFGGAATEPCACGSLQPYNKCCGRLHNDKSIYTAAAPDEVVRARYSAYSKRVVDFIVQSTHPENESFNKDIQHWKKTIADNCYDNFVLKQCDILSVKKSDDDTTAWVQFRAHMTQRDNQERTAFTETSTFQRDPSSGAWLYLKGETKMSDDIA